jgi:hypothetical protein
MGLYTKIAGAWQEIGVDAGGSSMKWAKVSGGTVTEYTKADGSVMQVHTFTANGTLSVDSPGYAEVFMISAGGPGWNHAGAGGRVREGIFSLPLGAQQVVVGQGVGGDPNNGPGIGAASNLGAISSGSASQHVSSGTTDSTTRATQYTSSITGTPVTYGRYGSDGTRRANRGDGGWAGDNSAGSAGIVIVAVQKSAPVPIGGEAVISNTPTGQYTDADGTWKYLQMTANTVVNVTQYGYVDCLVVAGGGGGGNDGYAWGPPGRGAGGGGAGGVRKFDRVVIDADILDVSIGAGGGAQIPGSNTVIAQRTGSPIAMSAVGGGKGAGVDYETATQPTQGGSGGGGQTQAGAPGIDGQGFAGSSGAPGSGMDPYAGGGGGGAGGPGQGGPNGSTGGAGGVGLTSSITGSPVVYGVGGQGGSGNGTPGATGAGFGGGGGGGGRSGGRAGNDGVAIIRWRVA